MAKKILILDDDETIVTFYSKVLLYNFPDFIIKSFNNPKKALDYLKDNTVDIIITDDIMPDMNGVEFIKNAKKYVPDSYVFLVTGYVRWTNDKEELELIDQIVFKPISISSFANLIRKVTENDK